MHRAEFVDFRSTLAVLLTATTLLRCSRTSKPPGNHVTGARLSGWFVHTVVNSNINIMLLGQLAVGVGVLLE